MNSIEHFLELRLHFQGVETHRSFEISLEELSEILNCSTRNVRRLLKNMEKEGLVFWKPGGGRGRRSRLYFRCSLKKALLSHIQDLLKRGKYREALSWVKREGLPADVREACFRALLLEFSFPRIDWTDCVRMMKQSSGRFKPVLISSASGKWMLVEDGRIPAANPYRARFSRMIELCGKRE